MLDIAKQLKSIFLFSELNRDELNSLILISSFEKYEKGSVLFYEGDPSNKIHILLDGTVKAYKTDMKENEIVLHYFYPTALIAEMANFHHIPFPATAEFEVGGSAIKIDYELFEKNFLKNPAVSFGLIKSLSQKVKYLENVITEQLTLDSTSRVAKFLYENGENYQAVKHYKIATILNITPETLSRVFKKLKQLGLISDDGKNLCIIDRDGLKELYS
jgi:CRP/FNR family transcriptional regulator